MTDDIFSFACSMARAQDPIHAEATSIRTSLTWADIVQALTEARDPEATALLNAVLDYDAAEMGRLMNKVVQDYCRALADPGRKTVFERKQAGV
jgi:hypothetical protein